MRFRQTTVFRSISPGPEWLSATVLATAILAATQLVASCAKNSDAEVAPLVVDDDPEETYLVGIRAEDFHCDTILESGAVASILGGRVQRVESQHTPPIGVPSPCNYVSNAKEREPLHWSVDLDCREGALNDASQLMVNYADSPGATPVRIGQSALDHHDSALLFIDDDTPCYGRVLGPDSQIRSKLGMLVVGALTPHSAPTGAHIFVRD